MYLTLRSSSKTKEIYRQVKLIIGDLVKMFNIDSIINLFNNGGIMLVSALCFYGITELLKLVIKGEKWKDYVPYIAYILSFIVYLIIAIVKGYTSPIWTALGNALLFLILESSSFLIIKAIGKLIKEIIDYFKGRTNAKN